jgi:hypothetical protein
VARGDRLGNRPRRLASPTTDDLWIEAMLFDYIDSAFNVWHNGGTSTSLDHHVQIECRSTPGGITP